MKILLVSDSYYPAFNGVVSSVVNFANGLVELGHEVMLVVPGDGVKRGRGLLDERVQVVKQPAISGKVYPDLWLGLPSGEGYRKMRRWGAEVICCHTPYTLGWWGLTLAKWWKVPVVFCVNTRYTHEDAIHLLGLGNQRVNRWLEKLVASYLRGYANRCNLVGAISKAVERDVRQMGIKKPVALVHLPIPFASLVAGKKGSSQMRQRYGKGKNLVYVGRVGREKKLDQTIRLVAGLKRLGCEWRLIVVGDGPDRNRLEKLARDLDCTDEVVWVGRVAYDELVKKGYFYVGDVFISLSMFEAQGMSTVEAMACGLPVIGAKGSVTEEIVGKAGLMIDGSEVEREAKKVADFLRDREKLTECGREARKTARHFSEVEWAERLADELEKLVRGSRR